MGNGEIGASDKLYHLIELYGNDPYCLDILRFWAEHPNLRLNRKAVINAFYAKKPYVERALKRLVDDGVVRTRLENNDPIYSLAEDGSVRSLVPDLVSCDLSHWGSITSRLHLADKT